MSKRIVCVIGSGGAKGLVFLPILREISKKAKIDTVYGTSIGSILGGMWGIGYSFDEIIEISKSIEFKKLKEIFRPEKRKKLGLISHEKILEFLDELYSEKKINECVRNIGIFATNVSKWKADLFTNKDNLKLSKCVMASCNLPGIFPPFEINGNLYYDGAVRHPSNADIAYKIEESKGKKFVMIVLEIYDPSYEKMRKFFRTLIEFKPKILNRREFLEEKLKLVEKIMTSEQVSELTLIIKKIFDLVIENQAKNLNFSNLIKLELKAPNVEWYEFHKGREIIEAGENQVESVISKLEEKKVFG